MEIQEEASAKWTEWSESEGRTSNASGDSTETQEADAEWKQWLDLEDRKINASGDSTANQEETSAEWKQWPDSEGRNTNASGDSTDNQEEASAGWKSPFAQGSGTKQHRISRRIHILGNGSVGLFMAHSLAGIPNRPPITFLSGIQSNPLYTSPQTWQEAGECVEMITDGMSVVRRGFDFEPMVLHSGSPDEAGSSNWKSTPSQEDAMIWNLIVSVKAPDTVAALSRVTHRLCRDSTITFLQNGIGQLDEVNQQLFPDIETRPNYVIGVISHGITRVRAFTARHTGFGTISIGIQPRIRGSIDPLPPTARYIIRTITRTPLLAAVPFAPTALQEQQLDKLAINSVINPLTALANCTNGELLHNVFFSRVYRLLLAETSLVIRSLPELKGVPNVNTRYDPRRLEFSVIRLATRTAQNVSSMLQDVRAHKRTEIDYINGYIIRRGEEMGIKSITNYAVMQLVKARSTMSRRAANAQLPDDLPDSLTIRSWNSQRLSDSDQLPHPPSSSEAGESET